jgi:hypothetical protein
MQSVLKSNKNHFKFGGSLPEKPKTYIVEYAGEKDFKIFETILSDSWQPGDVLPVNMLFFYDSKNRPEEKEYSLDRGAQIAAERCWPLFLDLAWLEDIPPALKCTSGGLTEDQWSEIDYLNGYEWLEENKYSIDDCLKLIGDNPRFIHKRMFQDVLIKYLEDAKKKDTANGRLDDRIKLGKYLIPKKNAIDNLHKGNLARELMMKLTKELIGRCEKVLGISFKGGNNHKRGAVRKKLTGDQLKTINDWAQDHDARIAVLSQDKDKLSPLLLGPGAYINRLLKQQ